MGLDDGFIFDASELKVNDSIIEKLSYLYKKYPNLTKIVDKKKQTEIRKEINKIWPQLIEFTKRIKAELKHGNKAVVVRGFSFDHRDKKIRDLIVFAFTLGIGNPTPTDFQKNKKIIWDVTPKNLNSKKWTTFSENNKEAELHTDTQYRPDPEKFMALFVLRQAKDGGSSSILNTNAVIEKLSTTELGKKCINLLSQKIYPFRVPTEYTKERDDDVPELLFAPIIIDKRIIRFRYDTLIKGFLACKELATEDRMWAVEYFNRHIHEHPDIWTYDLKKGEILLTNNHEVLHGRSSFKDSKRHILRVRMAEE